MPSLPVAAVAAFARRIAVAGFLQGAAVATFVLAAVFVVAGIAVRWNGGDLAPRWWWATALVPVVAAGCWRALAVRVGAATAAAHLDRRLQLEGMLLSLQEGVPLDAEWQERLVQRLQPWRTALPALPWQRVSWRPGAALLLAVLLVLWPAGTSPAIRREPGGFAGSLQSLQERLETAIAEGLVSPETLAELGRKVASLAAGALPQDPAAWRELDALAQQIAREQLLANLAPARTAGGAAGDPAGEAGRSAAMQQAVEALRAFAADAKLPAMARGLLEQALREAGGVDGPHLAADLARWRELAERFAGNGGDFTKQLAKLGLGAREQEKLRGLATTLHDAAASPAVSPAPGGATAGDARAGDAGAVAGEVPSPGTGSSVSRASGSPVLRWRDPQSGGASREFVLPTGEAPPHEWVASGTRTSEPTVAPVPGSTATGEAPAGQGGVSWQLQVAPRHRAIVQRFFAADPAAAKERR